MISTICLQRKPLPNCILALPRTIGESHLLVLRVDIIHEGDTDFGRMKISTFPFARCNYACGSIDEWNKTPLQGKLLTRYPFPVPLGLLAPFHDHCDYVHHDRDHHSHDRQGTAQHSCDRNQPDQSSLCPCPTLCLDMVGLCDQRAQRDPIGHRQGHHDLIGHRRVHHDQRRASRETDPAMGTVFA